MSRVKCPTDAIYHNRQKISDSLGEIEFCEIPIDFYDLVLYISKYCNEPYCFYSFYNFYEKDLNLRNYDDEIHLLEECEVYKLIKKNR